MPYTSVGKSGQDWPVANKQFDAEVGMRIFRAGIDNKVFAEECGFDWIGNNEHHMSPYGLMPNPNLVGAVVAARTKRVKILQSSVILPLSNPIRVAEEYAMLDVLSGGRLVAGMFRGIPHEYVAYNMSPNQSYGRLIEATKLIIKAWTEPEPFGWEGEYYQYRAVSIWPRPIQQPHPRIIMSGSSPRSAEIAGQFGAMFGIAQLKTFDNARNLIEIYRESSRAHGFDPKPEDVLVGLTLSIAEDAEEAKKTLTNGRRFFADVLGGGIRTAQKLVLQETRYYDEEMKDKFVDARKSAQVSVDDLLEQGTIPCGTPEMVVDQLKRVHAVMGHGVTNINMKVGNVPDEIIYKGMDLFKERVLPHVRDL